MKIMLSVLAALVTLTVGMTSLANEGGRDNNALFPEPTPVKTDAITPLKAQLVEPAFFAKIADSKVKLTWKSVETADAYHVQVAKDPQFKWLLSDENLFNGTSFEVANLEAGKQYFWRVAAIKTTNLPGHRKSLFTSSMFEVNSK